MSVQWSQPEGCYVYSCLWGCRGTDFESQQEAIDAFLEHRCFE